MIPRKKLKYKRVLPGEYVDGVWVEGRMLDLFFTASVQPTTPKQMQSLPEGRRNVASFSLYTNTELRTAEQHSHQADIVVLDDGEYEVSAVERWNNGIIPHFVLIVTKVVA